MSVKVRETVGKTITGHKSLAVIVSLLWSRFIIVLKEMKSIRMYLRDQFK